jgi:hypothetical protein
VTETNRLIGLELLKYDGLIRKLEERPGLVGWRSPI